MSTHVEPFDPGSAPEADLLAYYRTYVAIREADWPGDPILSFEKHLESLRVPTTHQGASRLWAARHDGQLVGVLQIWLLTEHNDHLANVGVRVHPDQRRRGFGTSLLRAALPVLRAESRSQVAGHPVEGSPAHAFARRFGFADRARNMAQRLDLTAVDRELWQVPAPAGYRLVEWIGETPAELLDSYAHARSAIHDAPMEGFGARPPSWTPQRVREAEATLRIRDVEQRVVVAVHESTGVVAGLTELELYPHWPTFAFQQDTAVLAEHRGHGLGRAIKATNLRRLVAERPGCERIGTGNAAANEHMLRVNRQIGFTVFRTIVEVAQTTDELAAQFEA